MKELVNLEENLCRQERNMEPINVVKAQCYQIENNRVKIEEHLNLIDDLISVLSDTLVERRAIYFKQRSICTRDVTIKFAEHLETRKFKGKFHLSFQLHKTVPRHCSLQVYFREIFCHGLGISESI